MIVITSIFSPTPAVERFAAMAPDELIVVGDRKSPPTWSCPGVEYLSVEDQERSRFLSAAALPWNHYTRKVVGYLRAIERGATMIAETDDDNTPFDDWSFPAFDGDFDTLSDQQFVNIYRRYTAAHVWPRGLPLDEVLSTAEPTMTTQTATIGVWQALADGDPDVDAVYRLTRNEPVEFDKSVGPQVLAPGTVCPFNSQNTAFAPAAFPLLYLPATVTFRFTDILRGIVAQPILWASGMRLGFTTATVFQDRNDHDYMQDFISEIPCYLDVRTALEVVTAEVTPDRDIKDNLTAAYAALARAGVVTAEELDLVAAWTQDLTSLGV